MAKSDTQFSMKTLGSGAVYRNAGNYLQLHWHWVSYFTSSVWIWIWCCI
jgi:hypothetical protein